MKGQYKTSKRGNVIGDPQAWKEKISLALKGKRRGPLSDEHKSNLSKALTGRKQPPRTKEHQDKLNAARKATRNTAKFVEKKGG